jgi:hypothetical protein
VAENLPKLWPSNIQKDARQPADILRHVASQLSAETGGVLDAKVDTWTSKNGNIVYEFQIVANTLSNYTYSLFKAWHAKDMGYPITIQFEEWTEKAKEAYMQDKGHGGFGVESPFLMANAPSGNKSASSPTQLLELLKELLNSSQTTAVLNSLMARINELQSKLSQQNKAPPLGGSSDAQADTSEPSA